MINKLFVITSDSVNPYNNLALEDLINEKVVGFIAVAEEKKNVEEKNRKGLVSVYVDKEHRHCGLGTMLLRCLIQHNCANRNKKELTYQLLDSRIFTNNAISIRLHEKAGFKKVRYCKNSLNKNGICVISEIHFPLRCVLTVRKLRLSEFVYHEYTWVGCFAFNKWGNRADSDAAGTDKNQGITGMKTRFYLLRQRRIYRGMKWHGVFPGSKCGTGNLLTGKMPV